MKIRIASILLLGITLSCSKTTETQKTEVNNKSELTIAFGSCAHSYDTLKIMDAVVANNPKLWIWLGDIVYGDTHDMAELKEKYDKQKNKPEYQILLNTSKIIGIWDDHDYGVNDAGKFYSKKEESKELLLDFLDVANDDQVRSHSGAYSEHDLSFNDKLVKVILLDTRYFRDTLAPDKESMQRYKPNHEGDILGEDQWLWLEEVLKNSKADFHILGSSIQLIPVEQGFEKWANFPLARQRMFDLLTDINPKPLLVISGDRHIAEISKIDIEGLDYPLYDFTSSGLTHTWGMYRPDSNKYRVDSLIVARNFGLIKLSWDEGNPNAAFEVRGEKNELIQETTIKY
ncbi:MAG: alkaline phosphatase D family protein [Bacteroidota bacterium]